MDNKKRWRVSGSYNVAFDVELEADSEAEARRNVQDDPNLALDSAISEAMEIDDCEEIEE